MTKHDLKELAAMGAELGAAKAEVERLRGLLREVRVLLANSSYKISGTAAFLSSIDSALSQQAEPTDTYTAVDMATAAAQGFRDGQAAVEPAPAQDNGRSAFQTYLNECAAHGIEPSIAGAFHSAWKASPAQPIRMPPSPYTPGVEPESMTAYERGEAQGRCDMWAMVKKLNATAPIAQTEQMNLKPLLSAGADLSNIAYNLAQRPGVTLDSIVCEALSSARKSWDSARAALNFQQGKFRMGDLVKKSTGSEWEGRVVGWYSTEQTAEGYAVESSAHRNSVQIYPAKALEAVDD